MAHDCQHIMHQTIEQSLKKIVAGIGSVEQVGGLICITSPLEHFSKTGITVHYTQVNTQPDLDWWGGEIQRGFLDLIYIAVNS